MDPVSAFFFAAIVATVWVSDWCKDFRDGLSGNGLPRHERRVQQRAHEHELRKLRLEQRHAERMAGKGGPTIAEAVAHRLRQPKSRDDMHGVRAWWFDLCADRASALTRERREREARRARGEQEWQKATRGFRDWYCRAGERAGQRWQERNAPRDPHGRRWVDSERVDEPASTDWPDPNAHNPGTEDAQVVDDPQPPKPEQRRLELEPGWPEWGAPRNTGPESMSCPDCRGAGCRTCGGDGHVPSWLADPMVNSAADSWAANLTPVNPPGTAHAITGRIPKPLGGSPAEPASNNTNDGGTGMGVIRDLGQIIAAEGHREPELEHNVRTLERTDPETGAKARAELNAEYAKRGLTPDGLPTLRGEVAHRGSGGTPVGRVATGTPQGNALNGETVDPESLGGFASGMQQVAAAMQASIEASIANLTSLGVSGGPIDDLVTMADAAATLAGRSQSTAAHAASHADIQGVAQSDPTVGGEQYLNIGASRR